MGRGLLLLFFGWLFFGLSLIVPLIRWPVYPCPFQIRVVNAFRHGMDSQQLQQASSNPNIQRVLQKQASLSGKRFSLASNSQASMQVTSEIPAAPGVGGVAASAASNTRITIPEQSFSHTETAV